MTAVLELVSLHVQRGQQAAFETAFAKARRLLQRQPGCLAHELRQSMEDAQHYTLLIEWRTLEDRTLGYYASPAYLQFSERLAAHLQEAPHNEFFRNVVLPTVPGQGP